MPRFLLLREIASRTIAKVMAEYTENLQFADALLESGIPKLINGLKELDLYAATCGA
jgi:hypothetical protein